MTDVTGRVNRAQVATCCIVLRRQSSMSATVNVELDLHSVADLLEYLQREGGPLPASLHSVRDALLSAQRSSSYTLTQGSCSASLPHVPHVSASLTQLHPLPTPAPSIFGTPRELSPDVRSDFTSNVAPAESTRLSFCSHLDGWNDFDLTRPPSPLSDSYDGMLVGFQIHD